MQKKIILITGISSGLGKETAALLAKAGHIVYGSTRRSAETPEGVLAITIDVQNTESINAAVQKVIEKEGRIDVLINNAGMGLTGAVEEYSEEEAMVEMNTNFMGTFRLCKAVLPYMRKEKQGTIINMSSIGGIMGLPFQGFYSASKFAIEGMSEALRYEVKQFNIKVVVLRPGDFYTSFTANRKKIVKASDDSAYAAQFTKSLACIERDESKGQKPIKLAKKILQIVGKKSPQSRYIISSFEQKLAVWLKSILPPKLFYLIIGDHYGIK